MFYLAQSYRDSRQWEKSLEAYLRRAELGGWAEETFFSLYQAGRLMEIINDELVKAKKPRRFDVDQIVSTYFRAHEIAPWRAETLWCASRICRVHGRFTQGYNFARTGAKIGHPEGALFVTQHIYEWGLLDELAVTAFWSGNYGDAVWANKRLLEDGKMPKEQVERVQSNFKLAVDALIESEKSHG